MKRLLVLVLLALVAAGAFSAPLTQGDLLGAWRMNVDGDDATQWMHFEADNTGFLDVPDREILQDYTWTLDPETGRVIITGDGFKETLTLDRSRTGLPSDWHHFIITPQTGEPSQGETYREEPAHPPEGGERKLS